MISEYPVFYPELNFDFFKFHFVDFSIGLTITSFRFFLKFLFFFRFLGFRTYKSNKNTKFNLVIRIFFRFFLIFSPETQNSKKNTNLKIFFSYLSRSKNRKKMKIKAGTKNGIFNNQLKKRSFEKSKHLKIHFG